MNVLFLCTWGRVRAATAARLFSGIPGLDASSAGTHIDAARHVSREMVRAADVIFAMEDRHLRALELQFGEHAVAQKTVVLDIGGRYGLMDDELIDLLIGRVSAVMPGTIPVADLRRRYPPSRAISASCWGVLV